MQSGVTARYTLKSDALQWLSTLNSDLVNTRGKPAQEEIAQRAGLDPNHFSRVKNGWTRRLGEEFISGLVNLAMENGASRAEAEENLFDFITAEQAANEAKAAA